MPIRPFGYEPDRFTVREDEADLIREAARRLVDGEALNAIARDFNARHIRTPHGNEWQPGVLRRVLKSERIAGQRRMPDGSLVDGGWPAVVTAEERDAVLTQLSQSKPGPSSPATGRTYLLTGGLAVCGLCLRPLVAKIAVKGKRSYACSSTSASRGCGKVRITASLLEDEVGLRVMDRFRKPAAKERLSKLVRDVESRAADADVVLAEARRRLDDLGKEYAKGRVTADTLTSATTTVRDEMASARADRRLADRLQSVAVQDVDDFVLWWEGASLEQQRTVLDVVLRDVAVMPNPVKGSRTFAPERVKIRWR